MLDVSVIIPTWNRRSLLPRAIKSVLHQKDAACELIIVDDGSTDGTREMLAAEYPGIRYLTSPRSGPSRARNLGVEAAAADRIAFLDSDDEWLPSKIRMQLDFFKKNPDYRIVQTEEIWVRNGIRVNAMKKHQKFGGDIFEKCLPLCIISPSAVMMEKSLFEEAGKFDESFPACEDYELWLRITCRYPVGLISKPGIIKYGGHEDQLSRTLPAMDRFRIRALAGILLSGKLSPQQAEAARAMLRTKLSIYTQGAFRRGRHDAVREVEETAHAALQT